MPSCLGKKIIFFRSKSIKFFLICYRDCHSLQNMFSLNFIMVIMNSIEFTEYFLFSYGWRYEQHFSARQRTRILHSRTSSSVSKRERPVHTREEGKNYFVSELSLILIIIDLLSSLIYRMNWFLDWGLGMIITIERRWVCSQSNIRMKICRSFIENEYEIKLCVIEHLKWQCLLFICISKW